MGFGRGVVDVAVARISWVSVDEAARSAKFPGFVVFPGLHSRFGDELVFDCKGRKWC